MFLLTAVECVLQITLISFAARKVNRAHKCCVVYRFSESTRPQRNGHCVILRTLSVENIKQRTC